jgi:hypothetical protein
MLEKLVPLLGKSIESEEIKSLFTELGFKYPIKTTCTANNSNVKGKFEKDGLILYFGLNKFSRFTKPILGKTKGTYIGVFHMIELSKKCKEGVIPFGVKYGMKADELTAIFGEPKVTDFVGKSTIWRKNYGDKHELLVNDSSYSDGETLRSVTLQFIFEPDL